MEKSRLTYWQAESLVDM
jgi:hypothetical protein